VGGANGGANGGAFIHSYMYISEHAIVIKPG
jgi:hypothetical protein